MCIYCGDVHTEEREQGSRSTVRGEGIGGDVVGNMLCKGREGVIKVLVYNR